MNQPSVFEPWIFRVNPYADESFAHFLGRFRRANYLSCQGLAKRLGISSAIVRDWETPSRQRTPTPTQLMRLSQRLGVEREQLAQMLPHQPFQMHFRTRLCSACYSEVPVHRWAWQKAGIEECARHQLKLLSACPSCGTGFRLPSC